MITKTIVIYVFIDDLLKEIKLDEPTNRNMSDAEVITTVLESALYFSGHHEKAMSFMSSTGMIKQMLSKSRFNRRLHQIRDLIVDLFFQLSSLIKELNISSEYSIDSFPISTCDNIRIANSKLIQGEIYRGKKISMSRYFYGYNVHLLSAADGIPVEYTFLSGRSHDFSVTVRNTAIFRLKTLPVPYRRNNFIQGSKISTPSFSNTQKA